MTDAPETPLWEELKTLVRLMAEVFGAPVDLLAAGAVARGEGVLIRRWLEALEAIARALLVAMAARMPAPAPRSAPRAGRAKALGRSGAPDAPSEEIPDPDEIPDSERWAGVVFRTPRKAGTRRRRARGARAAAPRRFVFTRALAYRFEALIRVAEAPEAHARRLARRLRAEPGLAARLLVPPRACAAGPPLFGDVVEDALAEARAAPAAFAADTG